VATAKSLSDLQLDVMREVWTRSDTTVAEVHDALQESRGLALTTVATVMNRLTKDEVLARTRSGRTFVYRALVSESEVTRSAVHSLLGRLFGGDPRRLVSHMVSQGDVSAEEIEAVCGLLEEGRDD